MRADSGWNDAACALCGSRRLEAKHTNGKYTVLHCAACDLAFSHPMPTDGELREFYTQPYFTGGVPADMGYGDYVGDEATHRTNAETVLRAIERAGKRPPGDLLDVGCAHGFLVDAAVAKGWRARGVDLSADAVRFARETLHRDVVEGTLHGLALPAASLDACTLVGTLDHFVDPFATLAEVARVLRPGGVLAASLGDISGLLPFHWKPPEHVYYFSRRSLEAALVKHGFRVKSMGIFWVKYTMKEFLLRLRTYLTFPIPPRLLALPGTLTIPTNEVLVVAERTERGAVR